MTWECKTVHPEDVPPWSKLVNPIWWLQTGGTHSTWTAPETNNGQPYIPDVKSQFMRNLFWWCRNPCGNFVGYVIGFEGRVFEVCGPAPVLVTTLRDANPPRYGWKYSLINKWFPFVSYWNGTIEFYCGWRAVSGGFGTKFVWHRKS